jgi:hypothetical protein
MDFSMRKNGIRLLLLLAVVIGAAAVVQDLHFDNTLASTRASVYGVDGELGALNVKVSDFRAAQAGYLAAGQDPVSWMRHASAMADEITATFGRIRSSSIAPDASIRLDAAAAAFTALVDVDTRARQALAEGQPTAAGEAIFNEGLALRERLASELSAARSAHVSAIERDMGRLGQVRLGVTAAALALVLLLTLLASRLNRQPPVSAAASMAQMLRELPPPVKSPLATPSVPIAVPAKPAAATATAPTAVTAPTVNLPEAAELCGDLAQVIDGSDVPGLLARTARLLEASGVIVWMADTDGRRLQPALTHGYSDKVLSRLGSLAVDADNVTSLAFRSRRSQQVNGGSSGAIAIPLVTANGCTGVLAAEVKDTKLAPDAIALARIIAAQFATIIAPVEEPVQARAAEA